MLHRFSTAFITGEFRGQLIVAIKFGRLLLLWLFFFVPCLSGFGCVCWRPVLDEAFKVWPYLLCRRSLALLRPPNNIIFRFGQLKQILTTSVRKKKMVLFFRSKVFVLLNRFQASCTLRGSEPKFLLPSSFAFHEPPDGVFPSNRAFSCQLF